MSCAVSHRCSTIVMQRMFCQRSTLRVALQWWGTPKIPVITSGCHCVLSLCHLKYCHLPKSLTMAYEKIHKISIPQWVPPSFILPQLCAHGALKVIKQLSTEVVLSLTLHQIIPPLHPLSSPLAVSGAPGLRCPQHPRRRPRRRAAPQRQFGRCQPPSAAVSNLRRRRAQRRQRLEGSTPWLSTAQPRLQREKLQSVEWSLSKLYSELAQWQPLSFLVFVKITKTTNWWNLPQQKIRKIRKRENRFLTPKKTYLNISRAFSSSLSHLYSRPIHTGSRCARLLLSQHVLWCLMVLHVDVLPSSCRECFVKGRHWVWAVRVISLQWWGTPKMPMDATVFCRFVTSCIVTCQISHYGVWENSQNPIPPTANTTYCPATALCTWRIQNHQATCHRGCSFTHSASHHPCTPPPINPTGRFRGPWPKLFTASTAAPAARSCSTAAVWPLPAAQCSAVRPQAPKGSETSTAGGLHPVALHRPTPAAVGAICGVKSVSFIFFNLIKIV